MFRCHAPSVVKRKLGVVDDAENKLFDYSGKRKSAMRGPLRKINGLQDSDDDEDIVVSDDEGNKDKKLKSSKDSPKIDEELKALLFDKSDQAREEYEARIRAVLNRPYVCPIPGYICSGRALGVGRDYVRRARYDPEAPGALVLYTPPEISAEEKLHLDQTKVKVHVVVDPMLSAILRPHQREGVKFMYDCVTGVKIPDAYGCIMGDEMGLGKTLQCITLVHTLLEQSPSADPEIECAVVVTPSSLVKNWANEFKKWLGNKIPAMVMDGGTKEEIDRNLGYFMTPSRGRGRRRVNPVLIISYETLRIHAYALKGGEIGLMLCDEGHRLKNQDNQTYAALSQLNCKRRVLMTGTPIQNDLLEYYSLVNFVNPGLLGTHSEFKKKFENPIIRGRDGGASDDERAKGMEKERELRALVDRCMIRRTNSILSKYLPTKYEIVVCCGFTEVQQKIYEKFIASKVILKALKDDDSSKKDGGKTSLQAINFLKKLSNHPALIQESLASREFDLNGIDSEMLSRLGGKELRPELSGKLMFLDMLLASIKSQTKDRVVLVSNYTQTLDLFEKLCRIRSYQFTRLDGSMSVKKRGKVVENFNDPTSGQFIFMLSSKAGGCGLNLIGANRLVMFDPDWNPANDAQAMARCWRDGQKKDCFTYRLLGTGGIEEKIFQRQMSKKALSDSIVDNDEDAERHFTADDLRQLFQPIEPGMKSHTHDSIKCKRCYQGSQIRPPPSDASTSSDLKDWHHCHNKKDVPDIPMRMAWDTSVTFAFYQKSHEQKKTV